MIAVHLEPKGLSPSAIPIQTKEGERHALDATRGSRKLRDAILVSKGIAPPKPAPVVPRRPPAAQLCPTCQSLVRKRTMIADIQQAVAAYYGINLSRLTSEDRRREVARPRQVAMYLASELTPHSIAEVGRRFNRDHTTVLHAIKEVNKRAESDPEEAFDVAVLRERIAA